MKTLKASLVASVIGTGAWMLGLTRAIWPAHPQLAAFFLTVVERAFPHLLNRRHGDPYQNLHSDLKGHIEERKRVL
jgi:hypothetical protein